MALDVLLEKTFTCLIISSAVLHSRFNFNPYSARRQMFVYKFNKKKKRKEKKSYFIQALSNREFQNYRINSVDPFELVLNFNFDAF